MEPGLHTDAAVVAEPFGADHLVTVHSGIVHLLYGPGIIHGGADEDDACVFVSEMVTATRVIAVAAPDVCQRAPSELALSGPPADRFRAAAPRAS